MRIPFFTAARAKRQLRDAALLAVVSGQAHTDEVLHRIEDQAAELLKLNRRRERLVAAAENLAEKFDDKEMAEEVSNHLLLSQLTPIVELLKQAGRDEAAKWWAQSHDDWSHFMTSADEDQADADHALYLKTGSPLATLA